MRRYKAAVREQNIQVEGHRGFTVTLLQGTVKDWEDMCKNWDMDHFPKSTKSPYLTSGICGFHFPFRETSTHHPSGLSEAQVKKELAETEQSRLGAGGIAVHETSPLGFIILGLELEESQYVYFKLSLLYYQLSGSDRC